MRLTFTLLLLAITLSAFSQSSTYVDPNIPKPASGYGADGTHPVQVDSIVNPSWTSRYITVYHPADVVGKVPTIFYSHAFGGNNPEMVDGLLYWIARKGYAVVFVPYQTIGVTHEQRYSNLLNGHKLAARTYSFIDTTRVGFMGWSYGGGASFATAYNCFTSHNWGSNGRFMFVLAQWYTRNISQQELQSFPTDVNLLVEIYDADVTNDHRLAIDTYNNINIPADNKDFVMVKSDTINGFVHEADHGLPNTALHFNALDYYGIYRLLDALADYTWNGSMVGKLVALGKGIAEQVTMPAGMKPLVQYTNPPILYPESNYTYPCSDAANPRIDYCNSVSTGMEAITMPEEVIYPNPATNFITVSASGLGEKIRVYSLLGELVKDVPADRGAAVSIDVQALSAGLYFIAVGGRVYKFIKE